MAYMSQERKQQRAPIIKAILKKYGVKGSLSVRNHSTLVLNIKSGKIDFIENFIATDANVMHGSIHRAFPPARYERMKGGRA